MYTIFNYRCSVFPVPVKGLYQTASYSLHRVHDVQRELERISMFILTEVETSHILISIRLYFILTILITEDEPQPSILSDCNFKSSVSTYLNHIRIFLFFTCWGEGEGMIYQVHQSVLFS
jgi:hypothetical protein